MTYIRKIKKNKLAKAVKIADLANKIDISRIPNPSGKDYARCRKYAKAFSCLVNVDK